MGKKDRHGESSCPDRAGEVTRRSPGEGGLRNRPSFLSYRVTCPPANTRMDPSHLDLTRSVVLIVAGFVAGVMNSIAGGGTLVTFPTLIFAGLPSIAANATSTVALLPAALGSAAGYRKQIVSVARWLKIFAPVSLLGGLLGGILLVQTPSRVFDWLVPFLILFATIL